MRFIQDCTCGRPLLIKGVITKGGGGIYEGTHVGYLFQCLHCLIDFTYHFETGELKEVDQTEGRGAYEPK